MAFDCATQTQFPMRFCDVGAEDTCAAMNYAISITPKFTASLSILGVSLIMYRFFSTPRKDRTTHDRLLLGMSIMNLWMSIGLIIGQWAFPYIEAGDTSSSSFCNWQGWILQLSSAVFWYNSLLATVFVLRIHFGWNEEKVVRYEPLLHVIAWLYPVITSFTALGLKFYGSAGPWCWISPQNDWARWVFYFAVLWVCMIYSACCMILLVVIVKRSDDRTRVLVAGVSSKGLESKKMGKKTREVALQATLYIATFLLTWVFGTANRIQNAVALSTTTRCAVFPLVWLHTFFVPLQGFGNFLVYIYPRIRDAKKVAKLQTRRRALTKISQTRKQALLALGVSTYKVVLGRNAILSNNQATDSNNTMDFIPLDNVSTQSSHSEPTAPADGSVSKLDQNSASSLSNSAAE